MLECLTMIRRECVKRMCQGNPQTLKMHRPSTLVGVDDLQVLTYTKHDDKCDGCEEWVGTCLVVVIE